MYKSFFSTSVLFIAMISILLFPPVLQAGSVEITGRAELNFSVANDLKTSLLSRFPGDNALYLVLKSTNAVMVLDMKFGTGNATGPNLNSIYVNELFVPWRVHNNLTVFFGYRNIADYDSFLGGDGKYKWSYNETGILWYKSALSFIYSTPWFVIDGGINPKSENDLVDFGLLFKSKVNNIFLSANLTGKIDFSSVKLGARIGTDLSLFKVYLASGYDISNSNLSALLIGGTFESKPIKVVLESDLTGLDLSTVKLFGYFDYKFGNDSVGISSSYNIENGDFSLETYYFTKLGQAEVKPSIVFDKEGFKTFNVSVSFGF